MRRTYRSKKGTSGALDHRDVLFNMDEKSSVFDAFYIQNLKQTKRELSCVGSTSHAKMATNKVRKRKYVKRLLKDVEPVYHKERLSASAYLTPDKSIRVNKVLDPFDMLLNSSPIAQETLKTKIVEKLVPKKETKTYVRKRKQKIKKCAYSSSSTESDKENTIDSDMTDIKTHELVVERISYESSKSVDGSIIKIVGNLSLINSLNKSNGSFNTSYKTRNRRTKNYQSPMMQKSPLCSTPCKEKYRGVSIFKFSPITQKYQMSPAFGETDDNNQSIILVSKRQSKESFKPSSLALISSTTISDKNNISNKKNKNSSRIITPTNKSQIQTEIGDNLQQLDETCSVVNNKCSCQITEIEPFLGFLNDSNHNINKEKSLLACSRYSLKDNVTVKKNKSYHEYDDDIDVINVDIYPTRSWTNKSDADDSLPNFNTNENQLAIRSSIHGPISKFYPDDNESEIEKSDPIDSWSNNNTIESYSYNSSSKDSINKNNTKPNNNHHSLDLPSNMDINETELKSNYTSHDNSRSTINVNDYSNKKITSNSSIHSEGCDTESLYDTCDSDQSSVTDHTEAEKEPIVIIEKINDSIFRKCYKKMLTCRKIDMDEKCFRESLNKTEIGPIVAVEKMNNSIFLKYYKKVLESQDDAATNQSNYDIENSINDSNEGMINVSNSENDIEEGKTPILITDSSTTDDVYSTEEYKNEEENDDRCVSFVTTRRKHEITNDTIYQFDNSYVRSSSTDCDQTVLSNKVSINKDLSVDIENTLKRNLQEVNVEAKENKNVEANSGQDNICSIITTRRSKLSNKSDEISPIKSDDYMRCEISDNVDVLKINTKKGSSISRQSTKKCSPISKFGQRKRFLRTGSRKTSEKLSYSENLPKDNAANEVTVKNSAEVNKTTVENGISENVSEPFNNTSILGLPAENICYTKKNVVNDPDRTSSAESEAKPSIVLHPGKKWERSLSIYKRMTMITDHFDQSILEDDCKGIKGRKYRQSVISTMGMQEHRDSLHNDSINSRRSTFVSNPGRPTIRFVKDPNFSRVSLNTSSVFDDLKGFLSEECDDTVIELSKLSIADSEREVTILDNFHESERVTTARDYVLRRCNQTEPLLFDECYPETVLKNCHKIGEGVYGEVFLWRGRDGRARVMKIVPIAGTVKVNGEHQKDFHEIISEIVIAMELSALRSPIADIERQLDEGNDIHALELHAIENATDIFNEVLAVRCVYGPYPSRLLDLWELYDECKGSENDNPASLPADQRYVVLELANAGQDLESYQFASAQQAHALFQQIAFGLAVAEEAFQFEHRDLHWGNVLIAPTEQKFATFVLRGRTYRVPRRGVAATVIDYSLSRLTLPLAAECAALYNDLAADEQLFDAVGDYQFEVYRLMRDKLGNDWKNFEPYTNILWLHYTVDKMITALRYKRTNTKIHKHYIEKLKGIKNCILEYGSAVQYVLTDIDF